MKTVQYENWDILLLFYIQMVIFLDLYTDSEHLELYLLAWTMYIWNMKFSLTNLKPINRMYDM